MRIKLSSHVKQHLTYLTFYVIAVRVRISKSILHMCFILKYKTGSSRTKTNEWEFSLLK